jgi:ABC-type transport system substrate-binding protein
VLKSIPEATTRLAMLKGREVDVAYALYGPLAEAVERDPSLKLEAVVIPSPPWISFVDLYDPKSPWADQRVRLAANYAVRGALEILNGADLPGAPPRP